jgi:acyl carrier protein
VADAEKTVMTSIKSLLRRRKQDGVELTLDSDLYDDLELDSLEVAELSATLEDDLGSDPYSAGMTPRTVGEVLEFYNG